MEARSLLVGCALGAGAVMLWAWTHRARAPSPAQPQRPSVARGRASNAPDEQALREIYDRVSFSG